MGRRGKGAAGIVWRDAHGYLWLTIAGRDEALARINLEGGGLWRVSYLEWDEELWPPAAFERDSYGLCPADLLWGDAWEESLGRFKDLATAKRAAEARVLVR